MAPAGGGGGEPEMEPWEVPLARQAGSAPRRVGGGFSLAPAAPDRILMTTYETYKALPENPRPYRQEDLDLVAEILRLAEALAAEEAELGHGPGEVNLLRLLQAYEVVLRRHDVAPAEDTYFYRLLLKLSLDPDPDWWAKFNRECQRNAQRARDVDASYLGDMRLLSTSWLRWRGQTGAGGGPGQGAGAYGRGDDLALPSASAPWGGGGGGLEALWAG